MHGDSLDAKGADATVEVLALHGVEPVGTLDEVDGRSPASVSMHTQYVQCTPIEESGIRLLQRLPPSIDLVDVDTIRNEGFINDGQDRWSSKPDAAIGVGSHGINRTRCPGPVAGPRPS